MSAGGAVGDIYSASDSRAQFLSGLRTATEPQYPASLMQQQQQLSQPQQSLQPSQPQQLPPPPARSTEPLPDRGLPPPAPGVPDAALDSVLSRLETLEAEAGHSQTGVSHMEHQLASLTEELRRLSSRVSTAETLLQRRGEGDVGLAEELSAEISNGCVVLAADVVANTTEYAIAADTPEPPTLAGTEADQAAVQQLLEEPGAGSPVLPGQEVTVSYPMYTRLLAPDDPGMGCEVYMRRRQVDPDTAEVSYSLIKVSTRYHDGTVMQHLARFRG